MATLAQRVAKRFRREHRSRDNKLQLATPDQFLFKNGNPMAILRPRPEDVAEKLRLFDEIPATLPYEVHQAHITEILCDKIPHQFIGYALRDQRIVDCSGKPVGSIQAGDSFVSPSNQLQLPDFMVTGKMHDEIWDGRRVLVLPRPDLQADSNTGIVLESPDQTERASIVLRGGAPEVDCHIPTLNRIWSGDPERDYRSVTAADFPSTRTTPPNEQTSAIQTKSQ